MAMSFKDRLSIVQKQIVDLGTNIRTYKLQVDTLRQAKNSFEKEFNSQNIEIRKKITTELQRVAEELKRHLMHHKNQNSRIQQQLTQLKQQKDNYQNYLKQIRQKLEDIQRQVGQ